MKKLKKCSTYYGMCYCDYTHFNMVGPNKFRVRILMASIFKGASIWLSLKNP
jgi:hypothetical protein